MEVAMKSFASCSLVCAALGVLVAGCGSNNPNPATDSVATIDSATVDSGVGREATTTDGPVAGTEAGTVDMTASADTVPTPDMTPPDMPPCNNPGQMICNGVCVDTTTDANNCGACGDTTTGANICATGQTCAPNGGGVGTCSACPGTETACTGGANPPPGACVDLTMVDPNNCGACGNTCGTGSTCQVPAGGGTPACICNAPYVTCTGASGSYCAEVSSDPNNCGACASVGPTHVCPTGAMCSSGMCQCPGGEQQCGTGAAAYCATITGTDSNNCGACGRVCPTGTMCSGGSCVCPPGQLNCNGTCIDPLNDQHSCGGCIGGGGMGVDCGQGGVCSMGVCSCPSPSITCNGPGGATCVNPTNDPHACGTGTTCPGIGIRACAAWESCVSAACTCSATTCADPIGGGNICTDTMTDAFDCGDCSNGGAGTICQQSYTCSAGKCACLPGLTECSNAQGSGATSCTDTNTDPYNCGGCASAAGKQCTGAQVCLNGACVAAATTCPTGDIKCDPQHPFGGATATGCIDPNNDVNNCGTNNPASPNFFCGNTCNNGQVCVAGRCQYTFPAVGCTSSPCPTCDNWTATGGNGPSATCMVGSNLLCVNGGACPQ
jgi:hypothetical protein